MKLTFFFIHTESELRYARWKKAVQRAMNWETTEPVNNGNGVCDFFDYLIDQIAN